MLKYITCKLRQRSHRTSSIEFWLLGLPVLVLWTSAASAGERRFTYVYEALTLPPQEVEYEQWVTWKTATEQNRDFDRFEFRHELEFGLTDHLQAGLYLSDWNYERSRTEPDEKDRTFPTSEGEWDGIGLELIQNLTNPVTDPIGISLYGEVRGGNQNLELEGKLILEKDIGSWVIAYNATLEAEWEGDRISEDNGEIQQSAGISYQFSPSLLAGIELLHEIGIPDWKGARDKAEFFLGPNVSYRAKRWWVTLTPLFQVSDIEDAEDFQMRLIVGVNLTR